MSPTPDNQHRRWISRLNDNGGIHDIVDGHRRHRGGAQAFGMSNTQLSGCDNSPAGPM